jgi:UDP-N-acetylglucosamine 1-carboxyvinyltransferase
MHLRIAHSRQMNGIYQPQGNKNEALPVIAASLLCGEDVHLENLPQIIDVDVMLQLAESVGATLTKTAKQSITLQAKGPLSSAPDPLLASRIRGSLLLAAPILAREGFMILHRPGGDKIGRRRIDTHLEIFERLGARVEVMPDEVQLHLENGFNGAHIFLDEASVMATENALMAAATAHGETLIDNAACEPHVQQLARMLQSMGVQIEGIGTNRLRIQGVGNWQELHGCRHRVAEDHIEVGSIIALAAATKSNIRIPNVTPKNYRMVRRAFAKLGVHFHTEGNEIHIPEQQELHVEDDHFGAIPRIHDMPWPGFPADLSSIAVVLACAAKGTVMIHEWMFESRLYWVDSLISMGARITQCDPHRVLVEGGRPLQSATLHSPDIRAGMALVIAGLMAEGVTRIHNVQQIDRGYESIETRLAALGADIQRVV